MERNPCLYALAVHQIANFIFNLEIEEKLREKIAQLVLSSPSNIQLDILLFDKVVDADCCIARKDHLAEGPNRWINSIKHRQK